MSWDLVVLNVPDSISSLEEIGGEIEILGSGREVRRQVDELCPGIRWGENGFYESGGYSIEFSNSPDDATVDCIMLFVRGSGDPIATLLRLTRPNGWRIWDISLGAFLDPENPANNSWNEFQEFRDRVLDKQ